MAKEKKAMTSPLLVGLALAVLIWLICNLANLIFSGSHKDSEKTAGVTRVPDKVESFKPIVTTNYPSKVMEIPEKTPDSPEITVSWDMLRDDLAYWVEINGGTDNGGIEYLVPARNRWGVIGYDPTTNHHYVRNVRFKLEPAPGQSIKEGELRVTAHSFFTR